MGIMQSAANLIQQVTTATGGFAVPVIFSTTDGVIVTAATCNAVAIVHGFYLDERGMAVVAPTSRVMVSEKALQSVSFPTRDSNNKLSLKGCGVTFTDLVTGVQATYVIREAVGNSMGGLTTCTLGNAGAVTPPGRTIIGWMPASITVNVTDTPGPGTQILPNGDEIPTDYSLNGNMTLTIPYMVGRTALTSFLLNNNPVQDVQYTVSNGTFNNAVNGGFYNGNEIKFDASIPIWQS